MQRGWTPLHVACWEDHLLVVEELLQHGADPNSRSVVSI